jgi:hypothetical protein
MPERGDPAKELTDRLWKAHSAWLERHREPLPQARIAKEVSERAGVPVDQTTAGSWFKGTPPKPWFLQPLADLYEVRFVWFVTGDGAMRDGEVAQTKPESKPAYPATPKKLAPKGTAATRKKKGA